MRAFVFAVTLVAAIAAVPASAAPNSLQAKRLIGAGELDRARALLEQDAAKDPRDVETQFLLGMIALQQHRTRDAIDRFRAALSREPDAARIRLELARAFFEAKDYANAQRQFERARASHIPKEVIPTIDRFMARIRQDRTWSYRLDLAVAPNSNINAATSAREAVLFGLPFKLADDARRKSGVGLEVGARATFAPAIGEKLRWRSTLALQHREYRGRSFDDSVVTLESGPVVTGRRWQAGLFALGVRRRIGTDRRIDGAGLRLDAGYYPDSRTALPLTLEVQRLRYDYAPAYDATQSSVRAGIARAITPSLVGALSFTASRRDARADFASARSVGVGASATYDLAGGFTVRAAPSMEWSRYDADDPFALVPRRDSLRQLDLSLLNRHLRVRGFTPRVGVSLVRRESSVALYDFTQRRLEIALTSDF